MQSPTGSKDWATMSYFFIISRCSQEPSFWPDDVSKLGAVSLAEELPQLPRAPSGLDAVGVTAFTSELSLRCAAT